MASCVVFPTLTATQVSTSESLVTTSTESISTGSDSVSTVVISTCAVVDSSSPCLPTITTSFITSPGDTTTVIVPATLTVDVPVTVLTTLFGSSCSSTSTSISSSSSFTPSIPTSTPTPSFSLTSTDTLTSTSTTTLIPVVTTPPPTAITTNSLVTSDGSTFLSLITTTSTQSPTTALPLSTDSPSNKIAVGPVVGGVVGGLAVLLLLGLLTWRLVKRQSKFSRFFSRDKGLDDYHHGPRHRGPLLEKPSYQYGMVGQSTSTSSRQPLHPLPGVHNAFGNSSGAGPAQGPPQSTAGQGVVGNDGGLSQARGQVGRPLSNDGGLGQASGPPGALGTDRGLGQTVAGVSHGVIGNSMPFIAHTGDPSLIPLITGRATSVGASGLHAAVTSSRPSSSRPSTGSSSQVPGPLVTPAKFHGGYLPTLQSWSSSHGYEQAHAGSSTSPNNNDRRLSTSSKASTSSVYSHSSWIGNSSTNPITDDNGDSVPPILPSMEASSHQQQHQKRHQRNSRGRAASRRQVTNNADYEYRPYADIGSSSRGGASSSQEVPLYDEQGRPLNIPPEKAPLVHLDGTLYQEPPGVDPRSGYEPPAYIE